ncbi:TPA: hypothetical protein I7765_21045 [Vibrio vulnificus]|uniref:Lipocalin-like domain-containing protein n=1 Tax=Vibrio vulnificus TaxID=672 RepID=A0A8H9N513_VIBVL|nr:hypothetical protein [Vibrio vulnificus]EGQ7854926.1 hypothetical protein [Vibrio vulnificus]EHD0103827.1 hypothetical protein [Vibrio vulnificus]EHI9243024.1 hypothetical protein [Vibrio vulnificus]EIO2323358.1 hypothetical protein [Vibrio vulnificus]EJO3996410.1 hypothetical protein [Vibrio vulnificus]
MKKVGLGIFLGSLLIGCSSDYEYQSASSEPRTMTYSEALLGGWQCSFSATYEDGTRMQIVSDDSFVRNGTSNSFGTLTIDINTDGLEETLEYSVASTGTWHFAENDKYLVMQANDIRIVNISHPGLDDIFDIGSMFPENISESAEVLDFTYDKITLRLESTSDTYSCARRQ